MDGSLRICSGSQSIGLYLYYVSFVPSKRNRRTLLDGFLQLAAQAVSHNFVVLVVYQFVFSRRRVLRPIHTRYGSNRSGEPLRRQRHTPSQHCTRRKRTQHWNYGVCDYCSCNRKRTQCTNAVFNTNKQTQLHTRLIERLPGSAYRSLHSSFMAISDSP